MQESTLRKFFRGKRSNMIRDSKQIWEDSARVRLTNRNPVNSPRILRKEVAFGTIICERVDKQSATRTVCKL